MRIQNAIYFLLLIAAAVLQSCSKSTPQNSSGSHSGGDTIIPPSSKYVVDTYAGGTTLSLINSPDQMCVDNMGYLYISETNHNCVIKIDPLVQTTGYFSGSFNNPGCVDDPFGTGDPSLTFPGNLWYSKDNQIFIGDYGCGKGKVANTTGLSSSIVYANPNNLYPDMSNVCQDVAGNIFIGDTHSGLYEVRVQDQVLISLLSGDVTGTISSMTMDAAQKNIYIAAKHTVQEISEGQSRIIAGGQNIGNKDGSGASALFGGAMAICMGGDGNIYVADTHNNTIRQVTPGGLVTTIAGDGNAGSANGTGDKAEFNQPYGIAFSTSGNNNILYVSDTGNDLIRRITFPK